MQGWAAEARSRGGLISAFAVEWCGVWFGLNADENPTETPQTASWFAANAVPLMHLMLLSSYQLNHST